jgi:hypothetical protein
MKGMEKGSAYYFVEVSGHFTVIKIEHIRWALLIEDK